MDVSLNIAPALFGAPAYRDLLLSDSGDLVLTSDKDPAGTHPILQNILQRCRLLYGEFFMDTSVGVPYFQQLFGQGAVTDDFEAALQNVILGTPGVMSLLQWSASVDLKTRVLTVIFSAQTTTGEVTYNGPVSLG